VGPVRFRFENFSLYGAVEPSTGERFFLELPQLHPTNFQIFRNECAQQYQQTLNIVLMDNGSCHTAKSLVMPENIVGLLLPPYSPELHPIERLWPDVNVPRAWVLPPQLEELAYQVETILRQYAKTAIRSLTSYPYFVQAVHALCS
jgi:transposase